MTKKLQLIPFQFLFIFSICVLNAQQSYYNDVDLTKTGTALKDELATKIISTHTNFLSYSNIWEASKATDVNPDDATEIILIYGYTDDNSTTAKTDDIDNQNTGGTTGWNREHTYPRSLGTPSFENSDTPGSDAHHLRPSNPTMNSTRGNQLFADGSGNAGNVTSGWYPGDEWKGDIARMMMYMYLRYGSQCLPKNVGVGSTNAVDSNMINLFLDWNAEDPVSDFEDTRNTYHENTSNTYAQGNRNPFIDNPYLATLIWGGTAAENRWSSLSSNDFSSLEAVSIFPNPSNTGNITVSTPNELEINSIEVFSVLGKKVRTIKNKNIQNLTTINNLNSGIYLVKISNSETYSVKKLIVK